MGGIHGMFLAQYEVLRERGHTPSEAFNETVEEATQSLYPLIAANGMDYMYAACSTTARRGAIDWSKRFKDTLKPVFNDLYDSVKDGSETQRSLDYNSAPDYRERYEKEMQEIRDLEIWVSLTVRLFSRFVLTLRSVPERLCELFDPRTTKQFARIICNAAEVFRFHGTRSWCCARLGACKRTRYRCTRSVKASVYATCMGRICCAYRMASKITKVLWSSILAFEPLTFVPLFTSHGPPFFVAPSAAAYSMSASRSVIRSRLNTFVGICKIAVGILLHDYVECILNHHEGNSLSESRVICLPTTKRTTNTIVPRSIRIESPTNIHHASIVAWSLHMTSCLTDQLARSRVHEVNTYRYPSIRPRDTELVIDSFLYVALSSSGIRQWMRSCEVWANPSHTLQSLRTLRNSISQGCQRVDNIHQSVLG